jgi:hypothetical protein
LGRETAGQGMLLQIITTVKADKKSCWF